METLNKLAVRGVYALINETDKRIYISYSTYVLGAVARLLRELKDGAHPSDQLCQDLDKLEVHILERSENLKLRATFYAKEYEKRGYELYRPVKYVQYKVKRRYKQGKVFVELVTNSYNRSVVVGVFEKMGAAKHFIETYYTGDIYRIIYANNELTREYMEKR